MNLISERSSRHKKTSLIAKLNESFLEPIFDKSKYEWSEVEEFSKKKFSNLLELRENTPKGLYLKDKLETNVQSVILLPHEINQWPICYTETINSVKKEHIVGYIFSKDEDPVKY
ncbi:MAG: hypothetical protein NUV46_00430 [Nanoarchaeota archaeon]|nr:hypothetical protein [Nanoarchaeota archaeon]